MEDAGTVAELKLRILAADFRWLLGVSQRNLEPESTWLCQSAPATVRDKIRRKRKMKRFRYQENNDCTFGRSLDLRHHIFFSTPVL